MVIESKVRLDRVHQAFDRTERGRSIDGSKLSAEEIVLALNNQRIHLAVLEIRPLIKKVKPLALKALYTAQRFSVLFS